MNQTASHCIYYHWKRGVYMTRYKKRKLAAAGRFCALILVPLAAALSARKLPELKSTFERMDSVTLGKEEYIVCSTPEKKNSGKNALSAEVVLSEGYGCCAEEDEEKTIAVHSPLDMVSDDPGAKPYPEQWTPGIDIIRTTYGKYSGECFFDLEKCGQVNNKTDIPNSELYSESRCLPNFTITDTDQPQVLIYHTHTTESFEPFVRENLDSEFNYRTTDETKNVVMVGDAIAAELEAQGIAVIHARDIHDYPSYNGSYDRSRQTILPILEQYPTIKVALDIHRDAIASDTAAYQPYITVNGREAAQIMIISGCDDGTLGMPDYIKNFHFASSLQQQIEGDVPGLTRPILFDYRHYNQDLTTGSLLIEVGSHGNTLEQVQYSGELIGKSLGRLLLSVRERN